MSKNRLEILAEGDCQDSDRCSQEILDWPFPNEVFKLPMECGDGVFEQS